MIRPNQMYFDLTNGIYTISHEKHLTGSVRCPKCKKTFDWEIVGNFTHCGVKCKPIYTITKIKNLNK